MPTDPQFAADLFRGTAELYDRHRLPYAPELINELLSRASSRGRALDLGCGTGQLAFALADAFDEVWAVDPEPDMITVVRSKINSAAVRNVRPLVSTAEQLQAPASAFDLIVIGNAFHRMPRQRIAERVASWLTPEGKLALCWSSSPWSGDEPWKPVFTEFLSDWQRRLGAESRIPKELDAIRANQPDAAILAAAGLVHQDHHEVIKARTWTPQALAGFVYATSFLPITIVGDRTTEFEADLSARLEPYLADGVVSDRVSYAFELFRCPNSADS